jgi:hypothetical protein
MRRLYKFLEIHKTMIYCAIIIRIGKVRLDWKCLSGFRIHLEYENLYNYAATSLLLHLKHYNLFY